MVNAGFLLAVESLGVAQALVVARLLSADQVGLYGIASVTVMTILTLKAIGIDEGYVQQDEGDQVRAFREAFSIDLLLSIGFSLLIIVLSPLIALLYADSSLVAIMLALSLLPVLFALQAPAWIYLRRMDFVRQRTLQAIVPVVTLVVTVALVVLGAGAWGLVIGALAGNAAAGIVAIRVSPYSLRLEANRAAAKRYLHFSAPIALAAVCGLIIRQGQTLAFDIKLGLAGAGYLTLAVTLTRYADRADQLITQTIYPAICAVSDSIDRLTEAFEKTNRLTAMWALPFGAGLALFAPGLVRWVIGDKWTGAILLIQILGVSTALYQLGFNWTAFHRAVGRTRPQTIYAIAGLMTFLAVPLPLLFAHGAAGFAWGLMAVNVVAGALRWIYMKKLLPAARIGRFVWRSLLPPVLASLPVLGLRALSPGSGSLPMFIGEIALFLLSYGVLTALMERPLLSEALGYLRSRSMKVDPEKLPT